MAKRKFFVELTCEIEIDDDVISAVDDKWRSFYYDLNDADAVATHVAFNMLVNGANLSQLDGFADKSDDMATVLRDTVHIEATKA